MSFDSSKSTLGAEGRSGRGRRPAAAVRAEALSAAGTLLISEGVTGFTLEKVALLSGVSRVTLNKYWPSRGALALDAYLHQTHDRLTFHDSGDITRDLVNVISAWTELLADPAQHRAFTQLIGAAQSDSDLASAFDSHYFGPRRQEALNLLAAAMDRGQLRPGIDLPTVVDMIWGACYHRLLLPNLTGTLTTTFITTLVETTLRGVSPDSGPPQTS